METSSKGILITYWELPYFVDLWFKLEINQPNQHIEERARNKRSKVCKIWFKESSIVFA